MWKLCLHHSDLSVLSTMQPVSLTSYTYSEHSQRTLKVPWNHLNGAKHISLVCAGVEIPISLHTYIMIFKIQAILMAAEDTASFGWYAVKINACATFF